MSMPPVSDNILIPKEKSNGDTHFCTLRRRQRNGVLPRCAKDRARRQVQLALQKWVSLIINYLSLLVRHWWSTCSTSFCSNINEYPRINISRAKLRLEWAILFGIISHKNKIYIEKYSVARELNVVAHSYTVLITCCHLYCKIALVSFYARFITALLAPWLDYMDLTMPYLVAPLSINRHT